MKDFDPDKYLASKADDFDPDLYLQDLDARNIGAGESALRGAAQGVSFGFADELTGAGSALYDVATTDKELSDIKELYLQNRDESRKAYQSAERANPGSYMAGNIAGGIAGSLAVPVGAGAGLGKLALQGAAMGGVAGLGASEADNLQDMAKDTAIGAGIGGAMPYALKGVGKVAGTVANSVKSPLGKVNLADSNAKLLEQIEHLPDSRIERKTGLGGKALQGFNKFVFGLDEDVTAELLHNPKALDNPLDNLELNDMLIDRANKLRDEITQKSSEAWDVLGGNKLTNNVAIKDTILKSVDKSLLANNHLLVNPSGQLVANPLGQSQRVLKEAERIKQYLNSTDLSESQLKKFILAMDNEIDWDKQSQKATNEFFKGIRHEVDESLKAMNPAYRDIMEGVAENTKLLSQIQKDFGLRSEAGQNALSGTDLTLSKIKTMKDSVGKDRNVYKRHNLEALDETLGEEISKSRLAERAAGGITSGSRNVLAGGVLGGVFGGGPVGGALGVGAGMVADKYGRNIGTGLTKAISKAGDQASGALGVTKNMAKQILQSKYGKYFEEAGRRGVNAAGVTHYLLYSKDAEYRRLYDEAQKED